MALKPVEILIKAKDEASGVFGGLKGKVAAVGAAIAGYFGISSFIGAIRGAGELQAKLSEVQAVSGATAEEMVALRQAAEEAGSRTKFTATEGAEALGNLARAGLSAKNAVATLPAVLDLAQAGGIGLADASAFVTKTVSGMGMAFEEAGRVADVLAAGANSSNTSVTELAQALSYAAPTANAVGLSLESTTAILGKFADAGISGSRAGTSLNAVLAQFQDPASQFRRELGAAGITTNDFEQALLQLIDAGPAGQRAMLAVGQAAGPALQALVGQGSASLVGLRDRLLDAEGSAARTAAVMEDNLPGAMNSLASAWDTVKNTLMTPVLPVLQDGVNQLANAFRGAVTSGTIGRFGEAIAAAFQAGLRWAQEFLAKIDFDVLAARMQLWASQAKEAFDRVGEYASNAGNMVQLVWGVMAGGVNTVMAAIFKLAEAFAGVSSNIQSGLALLMEGLARITFGGVSERFRLAAAEIRVSAGATGAVAEEFGNQARAAFDRAAEGAETARRGWAGLTDTQQAAAREAATSAQVMSTVAETLREVGGDADAMGQRTQAAAIIQREALEATRAEVARLRTEYEAALAAGNVQLAVEKLQAMQGALRQTSGEARATAQEVENAFIRLGITSSAELARTRDAAQRDFQIIANSGTATARDIRSSFEAYARAAIAANGGVVDAALRSKAAKLGLKVEADETGRVIVSAMNQAAQATANVTGSAQLATRAFQGMTQAAKEASGTAGGATATARLSSTAGGKLLTQKAAFDLLMQEGATAEQAAAAARNAAINVRPGMRDYQAWSAFNGYVSPRSQEFQAELRRIQQSAMSRAVEAERGQAASGVAAVGGTPVTINLNGSSTSINVASQADANALKNLLQQLASQSTRALI